MAELLAPTGISVLGEYGAGVSIRFDEFDRDFGGGHDESELVGPTSGLYLLRLKYGFLPQSSELTVIDAENSNAVTPWAVYVWRFYVRRKQDQAPFDVTFYDPQANTTSTKKFKFAESQLDFEAITHELWGTGLLLRQVIPAS
jgi:hypothetical protein